ncbi:universal stress protein [Azohydromonas caseinilytica]|uniref:Universal stress protein n=1 Tax=Azohydromonas caseinilytica TaxID=2728836 RepID=A0A848FHV3_9BURK|nr:universal stress protein [Azohydromonas caseinilytica]NML17859.1 universal stress protein [Azohydromonas caseinilytica]
MYQHLLVPVDGSALSTLNIAQATQLAQRLGARITFFHARPDLGATGEGAQLRDFHPALFALEAQGDSDALLGKAQAEAAALGVPCATQARITERPAQAILEVAQELGCDLIVMASHGLRGMRTWRHGSHTEKVLRQAKMPVLVTRIERDEPLTAAERATAALLDEHRSMAVVVKGMLALVAEARQGGRLDVVTLRPMLQYLRDFPERLHHPKEERHLHARLLQRHPGAQTLLEELERQHEAEYEAVRRMTRLVDRCAAGAPEALPALQDTVQTFATALWAHMTQEEGPLLALARQHLLEPDWQEIADAFAANDDPGLGRYEAEDLKKLFARIARWVPH